MNTTAPRAALDLLELHIRHFGEARPHADSSGHTVPSDTKSWSQILVSTLVGVTGRARGKGSDLSDGSDVKGANLWGAIDTPRFNGVLPAGRVSSTSKKAEDSSALDNVPHLYFVMWDNKGVGGSPRCRVWAVRASADPVFRAMADNWYQKRATGQIKSTNFQLHPPRNTDSNAFRNESGNLSYPLLFEALFENEEYVVEHWDPAVLANGTCTLSP